MAGITQAGGGAGWDYCYDPSLGRTFTAAPCSSIGGSGCVGNADRHTKKLNLLASPVTARFVRLNVLGHHGPSSPLRNTKGYSSTYLAMGFANVRAGTWYPPEH